MFSLNYHYNKAGAFSHEFYRSGKMSGRNAHDNDYDGSLQLEERQKLKEPQMYRVILHNDHYTTMEFVVEVLMKVFRMPLQKANIIMMDVHKKGRGVCGVFTYDIAATKVHTVHDMARERQFPLKCSYEEE
jgi:ATP-dependent Clp protease adaptor protein ClpS